MTGITEYWVDGATGVNAPGNGIYPGGTPYLTTTYAAEDILVTHGKGTDHNRLNIKSGSVYGPIELTSYGAGTLNQYLIYEGFDVVPGDGGVAEIDGGSY